MAMAMAVVMDDDDVNVDATKVDISDESDVQVKHRISVSKYKGNPE